MGKIICTKHGASGIVLACSHIHHAYSSNQKINLNSITGEFLGSFKICSDCLDIYKKNNITEEFLDWFLEIFKPVCSKCFKEWKELYNISILETLILDIDSL